MTIVPHSRPSRTANPALFVIGLAACEAAVGLAIILAVYRTLKSVNVDDINVLKW